MNLLIVLIVYLASTRAASSGLLINEELNDEWETFLTNFQRKYDPLTEISRRLIWEQNLKYIEQHNLEYYLGKHTYYLGINYFSDMTHEEFSEKYLSLKPIQNNISNPVFIHPENLESIPAQVDWRKNGYVTRVKDQRHCGSCWAFSSTGSLEGQYFRKYKRLISLSEQQLLDCSRLFGNNGCKGGWMNGAFDYVQQYGIEGENDYAYKAKEGSCKYDPRKVVTFCKGFVNIQKKDENDLAIAVATVGPISVVIDASHKSFMHYRGGIYNEISCKQDVSNHAVLVVGYDSENNDEYWIVKNSWGENWGLAGYIKMPKFKGNQCGIATAASYPNIL